MKQEKKEPISKPKTVPKGKHSFECGGTLVNSIY